MLWGGQRTRSQSIMEMSWDLKKWWDLYTQTKGKGCEQNLMTGSDVLAKQ